MESQTGLVLGPLLFPLAALSLKNSVLHDSQLQRSAPPPQIPDLLLSMRKCVDDVKYRMTVNKLKLNDDKTEAMIVSSGRMSRSLSSSFPASVTEGSASVPLPDTVKNLGVTLDCYLTMRTHVSSLVRSASIELRHSSSIRHLLSTDATKTLVFLPSFVLSRLDY